MTQPDLKTRLIDPPSSPEEARAWGDEMLLASGRYEYRQAKMGNIKQWYFDGIGQGPWSSRPNPVTSMDDAWAEIPEGYDVEISYEADCITGRAVIYMPPGKYNGGTQFSTKLGAIGERQSAIARAICIAIREIDNG